MMAKNYVSPKTYVSVTLYNHRKALYYIFSWRCCLLMCDTDICMYIHIMTKITHWPYRCEELHNVRQGLGRAREDRRWHGHLRSRLCQDQRQEARQTIRNQDLPGPHVLPGKRTDHLWGWALMYRRFGKKFTRDMKISYRRVWGLMKRGSYEALTINFGTTRSVTFIQMSDNDLWT